MSVLTNKVLAIATDYLGIGASRFLDRQAAHLKLGSYEMLREEHMEQFAWWVGVSAKLVLDSKRAAEFHAKIAALGKNP